jgi:SAM-dependent methyltransferase
LGCGSGDVEGPFAETAQVTGFDCNPEALAYARNRFPSACYSEVDIEALTPFPVDVLILTEVLEHMRDPIALVQRWFPLSQNVVITHPVNEPLDSGQSGGEHSWSYTEAELEEWLVIGGHTLEECFFYEMGGFRIGCVRGKRVLDRPL